MQDGSNTLTVDTADNNRMVLKAISINGDSDPRGISRKIPEDQFETDYTAGVAIEPPFDLFSLATMNENSAVLGPCIDAMAINICANGHRIIPRETVMREEVELHEELKNEIARVRNFFVNASLESTFTTVRERVRRDLEMTGCGYYEVIPDFVDPSVPAGLEHLPSWTMRLCPTDKVRTPYEVARSVQDANGNWAIKKFPHRKYFRKFIQRKSTGVNAVYFKEWGDPRVIDYESGAVLAETWASATQEQKDRAANAVIYVKLYSSRSPYGLPRFIGTLFSVYGNRQAEVINYTTLKCNNIPALMLLATNIQLTTGSISRIKEFVEERIQGSNNYSTILIVEAEPIAEGMKDPGVMKLELKPLVEAQHTDAMFVNYTTDGDMKVRRAFRLPPILLGSTTDYNRSTAEASRKLSEEQIFGPERNTDDDIFNMTIVPALGAASVIFRSNTPNVTDNYELTQLLAVAERSGGLSPHISRIIVEDVLGRDLPEVDPSINPQLPFTLTMLREQLKAQLDAEGNVTKVLSDSEVVSQLKYLKSLADTNDSISNETKKSFATLITLMEMGDTQDLTKVSGSSGKLSNGYTPSTPAVVAKTQVLDFHVIQKSTEKHIIGGAVLVPGVVDLQGDVYDEFATEAAAYYWLENYLQDPKNNGLKLMHKGDVIYDAARPIQSWALDRETTFKVDISAADPAHPSTSISEITYPKGTWMLFARVNDSELWEKSKGGELLGWSIGGIALVQQLKQYMNSRRNK